MTDIKKFEIFSGTGGVGKTTIATSRALHLAKKGRRVLLITIDPSKRLKDLLSLKDSEAGKVINIENPLNIGQDIKLDALLMSPDQTMKKIAQKSKSEKIKDNRIIKILSKPYGGLNEILSIVELQIQLDSGLYQTIVLDTPPGSHFLDFLESTNKIQTFFDQSFIDIFNYISNNKVQIKKGKKFITMIVSGGVKKLIGYLQRVTGPSFIDEFIEAVAAIYDTKDIFLAALSLQQELRDSNTSNWFFVASIDQNKIKEAIDLSSNAKEVIGKDNFIILNKCLDEEFKLWIPENELGTKLKLSFTTKEKVIKKKIQNKFTKTIEFPEILKISPLDQVLALVENWNNIQEQEGMKNGSI